PLDLAVLTLALDLRLVLVHRVVLLASGVVLDLDGDSLLFDGYPFDHQLEAVDDPLLGGRLDEVTVAEFDVEVAEGLADGHGGRRHGTLLAVGDQRDVLRGADFEPQPSPADPEGTRDRHLRTRGPDPEIL